MAFGSNLVVQLKIMLDSSELRQGLADGRERLNKFGEAAALAGEVIGGALAVYVTEATNDLLKLNAELNTLSQSLNISRDSLQLWQIAGETVGIDAEKMGDIFKDVNDKLGDFANTGGGEAVDLIKRLKLDINDLIAMSPDQAILKIADAMEKTTNMSTGEKTFLLESLADDASRLIPLLENGGAKLDKIREKASTNLILITPEQKAILDQANAKMSEIGSSMDGLSHQTGTMGAMLINAFGDDVAGAIDQIAMGVQDLPDVFMQSANDAMSAWAFATQDMQGQLVAVGALAGDVAGYIANHFAEMMEHARIDLTYFPVIAKAAFEAMAAYATAWVLEVDADLERFNAAGYTAFANILDQAADAFSGMADVGGDAVAFIINRLADLAGGAASALGTLSNVPGLENIGAGVQGVEASLRGMAEAASNAGATVGASLGAAADDMRSHAKASSDAAFNQEHLAVKTKLAGLEAIQAAQGFVKQKESQRDINAQIREENQAMGGLADGTTKAGETKKKFYVNQKAVNEALKEEDDASKKANAATKAHNDALKSAIESLQKQRIELENGKLAAEYYADRLNGLSDAEARAKAGATQYNSLLAERKRLQQEAAGASGSLVKKYQAHLADIGLDDSAMTGIDAAKSATDKAVVAANQYQDALDAVAESAKNMGATVGQSIGGAISGGIGGAVTSTITKVSGDAAKTAAYAVQKLQGMGWSKNQAIGIAANIQQESKFNSSAVGDSGKAYGIAQWHPDRQANFARAMGKNIRGSSLDDQLAFITHEMTNGTEKGAGNKLKNTDSAAQAAAVVSKYYERPLAQVKEMEHRAGIANGIAKSIGDTIPSFVAATNASKDIAANTATVATNTGVATVKAAEYGAAFDGARVTATDTANLLQDSLNGEMNRLVDAAKLQTKQAALTGEELRKQELKTLEIGGARAAIILQEEQLANYTTERTKLEDEAAGIRQGMAEQYTAELKKQNISQSQIADLVQKRMINETDKLLKNAEDTRDELLLTPAAYQSLKMAADGFEQSQIASIQHAEKLNEELKRIRTTADKIGDDLLSAITNAAIGGGGIMGELRKTLESSFADLVLKPTIQPITQAVSAGINGMMTGQANPWGDLKKAGTQTWSGMQSGGLQGAATAAGASGGLVGLLGGSQNETIGASIGAGIGNVLLPGLGGVIGGALGTLAGSLLGGKWEVSGAGLELQYSGGDVSGRSYTEQTKKGGLLSKTKRKTEYSAIESALDDQLDGYFDAIEKGIISQSSSLVKLGIGGGETAAAAIIDGFTASMQKLDFTGKSDAERQTIIDNWANGIADDLYRSVVGADTFASLDALAVTGESTGDTFARLVTQFTTLDTIAHNLDLQFTATGASALTAANSLASVFGGLDKLTAATDYYYTNFFSDEERKANLMQAANDDLAGWNNTLGLVGAAAIDTQSEMRAYISSLDLTTDAGQKAYHSAMGYAQAVLTVAGAQSASMSALDTANAKLADQQAVFGLFNDSLNSITSGLDDQLNTLESSYRDQIAAFEQARDAADSLRDALRGLKSGDLTTLTPEKQLAAAQAEFEKLKSAAKGGDVKAAKNLESAGEALLRLSREYNASSTDYSADFDRVESGWESVAAILEDQQDPQKDLLDAQNHLIYQAAIQAAQMAAVYGGILGGNTLLELMGGNISKLPSAIATVLNAVLKDLKVPDPPINTTLTIAEYKAKAYAEASKLTDPTAQIASLYPLLLDRAGDLPGINYWASELKKGAELKDVIAQMVGAAVGNGEWARIHPNSHATGLYSVPYDNYSANLHAGEAVVDAASMSAMRKYGIPLSRQSSGNSIVVNIDMQALLAKVDALTNEVQALRSERSQDARVAQGQRDTHISETSGYGRALNRNTVMRRGAA